MTDWYLATVVSCLALGS